MRIRKFNERYELDSEKSKMKTKSLTDAEFDAFSEDQVKRVLVCYNDGQGDHCAYSFLEIIDMVSLWYEDENAIHELSHTQIMDRFYEETLLTGNNSDCFYFDNEYFVIDWVNK